MNSVPIKYDVIYADPPWLFRVWSKRGNSRSAGRHYQTQPLEFLNRLNVPAIAADNAVLLLWATVPCLWQAFELGKHWGFTYKTVAFTWIKTNPINGKLFTGMGYYTRANAEIVLLFTKGKPLSRIAFNVPQVLIAPRAGHSEKPDEIRERIFRLFGNVPRVELFALDRKDGQDHQRFEGWDVFGNEVSNSIVLPNPSI